MKIATLKVLLFLLLTLGHAYSFSQANLILYNGKIFTSDKQQPWAEAIAIKGERILAVGKNNAILKLKAGTTKLIDLEGRVVTPGFNDAHSHTGPNFPQRRFSVSPDPAGPTPWEAIKDSIIKIAKEVEPGTMISANINPDLLRDTRARKRSLDSLTPAHPVILSSWTGHGRIANSAALKLIGYTENTKMLGGRLDLSDQQELSGLLEEYAGFQVSVALSKKLTIGQIVSDLRSDYKMALALGITSDQVMCTGMQPAIFQQVFAENDFGPRVRLIAFPFTNEKELMLQDWKGSFHSLNNKNYVSGVKLILDGTPIERLASTRTAYTDEPGNYGTLNFSKDEIKAYVQFCLANKQQVIVHAVGDSAITSLIAAMRSLHPDEFWKTKRVRIEHAELAVMKEDDLKMLHDLGIIIVQNPLHLALPEIMVKRYGGRTKYMQAMRSLLDHNIMLAIGSDGPINPFLNLMMATFHPDNPKEAISLPEALTAYTMGAAYAEFKENEKGSLVKGKFADLAVLSQDIFTINPNQLPATESILTIVGGQILHDKKVLK